MDTLTFITDLVSAIAWPAVAASVLFCVRKELPELVKSFRRLKIKDFEAEFGEAAEKVAFETNSAVPPPKPDAKIRGESERDVEAQLNDIAGISPRAAILEAWLRVETAAVALIQKSGATPVGQTPGPLRLRQALEEAGVLKPSQLKAYHSLHRLRNEAVHVPEARFSPTAVANYIKAALAMAAYLEGNSQ